MAGLDVLGFRFSPVVVPLFGGSLEPNSTPEEEEPLSMRLIITLIVRPSLPMTGPHLLPGIKSVRYVSNTD